MATTREEDIIIDPDDLLQIAKRLAKSDMKQEQERPRETELRQAVSATYYALFHTLARCGADSLVGKQTKANDRIWTQAYRALNHGTARKQCARKEVETLFSPDIQGFASSFEFMQEARHRADYDPLASFSRFQVLNWIGETQNAISGFNKVADKDRRAFAVYVLLKH